MLSFTSSQLPSSSAWNAPQRPPLLPPPVNFQTHDDIEFYRVGTSSYRATVNTIERAPYVSISHWWFNRAQATWFPSRKQIFLPKQAWRGLVEQRDRISQVIEPLVEPPQAFPGPG